jgi:ABC-2 type transport system permease protein
MYNFGTVFRFEVTRTLKKKSFWIMALAFPVIIGAIFGYKKSKILIRRH